LQDLILIRRCGSVVVVVVVFAVFVLELCFVFFENGVCPLLLDIEISPHTTTSTQLHNTVTTLEASVRAQRHLEMEVPMSRVFMSLLLLLLLLLFFLLIQITANRSRDFGQR
jgi:hypothetical protein